MDNVLKEKRRYSKVADIMKESQLNQLRQENAEAKLMRAFKIFEMGKQIKEVNNNAVKPDKDHRDSKYP